jgi:hypothetical protein
MKGNGEPVGAPRVRPIPGRYLHHVWLGAVVAGLSLFAGACGAPSASTAKPPQPTKTKSELSLTCTRVADVLSDGPDPTADPVGYALAQVLPLREISTSDRALKKDLDALASAYETVYKTGNKKGTEAAVAIAGKKVGTICPGAF